MTITQTVQDLHNTLPPLRQCNRHNDCDQANRDWLASNPGKQYWEVPVNMHCHDDDCEDCFGC